MKKQKILNLFKMGVLREGTAFQFSLLPLVPLLFALVFIIASLTDWTMYLDFLDKEYNGVSYKYFYGAVSIVLGVIAGFIPTWYCRKFYADEKTSTGSVTKMRHYTTTYTTTTGGKHPITQVHTIQHYDVTVTYLAVGPLKEERQSSYTFDSQSLFHKVKENDEVISHYVWSYMIPKGSHDGKITSSVNTTSWSMPKE